MKRQITELNQLKWIQAQNGWFRFTNPFDRKSLTKGDKTMGINFDRNQVRCFRTGYNSDIYAFLRKLGFNHDEAKDVKAPVYKKVNYSSKLKLPEDFRSLYTRGVVGDRVRKYIKSRGLDLEFLDLRGVGYSIKEGRIIVPFMKNNKLEYYTGRDFIGSSLKYKNCGRPRNDLFYNEDALDLYDSVYITEGPFDALTCGFPGVANCTKLLTTKSLTKLITCSAEYLFFIPDKGEYHNWIGAAFQVVPYKYCFICNLDDADGKDVNEVGLDNLVFHPVDPSKFTS